MNHQNSQKKSNFGLGVLIGAALGSVAAFFLSPKSGKENREMIMKKLESIKKLLKEKSLDEIVLEIFGKVTDEGKRLYTVARDEMNTRLDAMKETVEDIDKEKYTQLVDDVIERVKNETDATKERLAKLQDFMMNRWGKAADMVAEDGKKVVKAVAKK